MRKSTQPARHRNGAWQSSNEMGSIRDYGTLPTEHISLKESTFGQAAELKIQLDLNPEEITSYRRFMNETKKNPVYRVCIQRDAGKNPCVCFKKKRIFFIMRLRRRHLPESDGKGKTGGGEGLPEL